MFDFNSEMFKPIIGARLIREEAKEQTGLKKPGESPVEGSVKQGLEKETKTLQAEEGMLNIAPKGKNREIG